MYVSKISPLFEMRPTMIDLVSSKLLVIDFYLLETFAEEATKGNAIF